MVKKTTNIVETKLTADDRASRKFSRLARSARMAYRGTETVRKSIRGVALAGGAIATVAGGLGALATVANQRTREMQNLATATGQNVEFLQAMAAEAKGLGLNYDNVVDLAEEMNNKLGEFAGLEEMNSAKDALKMMGLEFSEIQKLSPEVQFRKIMDQLANMPDAQQASSAADMLFGGEASKFVGLLRRNGKSIEDIVSSYQELNFVTDKGRRGAIRWSNSTGRLATQLGSLGSELSGVLGLSLSPLIEDFTEFLKVNRDLINSKINEWGERLAKWVRGIDMEKVAAAFADIDYEGIVSDIASMVRTGNEMVSVAGDIVDGIGGIENATLALAALWAGPKVLAMIGAMTTAAAAVGKISGPPTGGAPTGGEQKGGPARPSKTRGVAKYAGMMAMATPAQVKAIAAATASYVVVAHRAVKDRRTTTGGDDFLSNDYEFNGSQRVPNALTRNRMSDDERQRQSRNTQSATAEDIKRINSGIDARHARIEELTRKMQQALSGGILDVNIKVDGAPVKSVGTVSNAPVVSKVGTNQPGYTAGEGMI